MSKFLSSKPSSSKPSQQSSTAQPDETSPFFWVNPLHQKQPKLAQTFSKVLTNSVVLGQSLASGVPLSVLAVMKMAGQIEIAGHKLPMIQPLSHKADQGIIEVAHRWIAVNNWLIDRVLPSKDWRISLPDDLAEHKKYLLVCNHQSWVDTSIIQYISQDRLPLTRFFAKYELIYIPVVGQAFYLLDFPMMKRHSKEDIAKNPKLAGQDLAEAQRACQMLKDKAFVLLNYLEGTRFSPTKHHAQNSPYRHLLKPKAGGLALAIASLGEQLDGILDMTLVYPDGVPDYNDLWAGKITRLAVDIRHAPMDTALFDRLKQGNYASDTNTKDDLHHWLDALWQQKDERITALLAQFD